MTRFRTPLSDLRAEALRLTCTCGATGTKLLASIVEGMPNGATLADLAALPCGLCGPRGRAAEITIIGEPPPAQLPDLDF